MVISARRDDIVDDFHGTPVPDPYRWLEDPASPATRAWVAEENAATQAYINATGQRDQLVKRLSELWDYPKCGLPMQRGGRYFFSMNSGLQDQDVLYWQPNANTPPQALIDPNLLSADGTVALTSVTPSDDGALLAYGTSAAGSDWQALRIRRVADGTDLPEVLQWCRYVSAAWAADGSGFYYPRFPDPATVAEEDRTNYQRIYWHSVGTPQAADVLIYERPDVKELSFHPQLTEDGAYVILHVSHGTDAENRIYYRPTARDGDFIRLLDDADAEYLFLGNDGPVFYFLTTHDAPRRRIIAIDTRQPDRANWRELVPQSDDPIDFAVLHGTTFIVAQLHDVHHQLLRYAMDGTLQGEIALPGIGAIIGLSGRRADEELFLMFTSFLQPPTSLRYVAAQQTLTTWRASAFPFVTADYETVQVFYPAKDGTRIPMFLTMRKGLPRTGDTPTLLYGYGGFDISMLPTFAAARLAWLERGGIFAVANLRGGGEYGEAWHAAGMLAHKQNVFDDFSAAAEWLIAEGYTRTARLAIEGRSNGGLLVAACMTQRPDLFGAVICGVPVIDMLRYHRFTIGRYWVGEYGNAEENPDHFRFLYAYSPLHNVHPDVAYPPRSSCLPIPMTAWCLPMPRSSPRHCSTLITATTPSCCASRQRRGMVWVSRSARSSKSKPTSMPSCSMC